MYTGIEIRQCLANWTSHFFCHWKRMENLDRRKMLPSVTTAMSLHFFPTSTKEVCNVQGPWHSPNTLFILLPDPCVILLFFWELFKVTSHQYFVFGFRTTSFTFQPGTCFYYQKHTYIQYNSNNDGTDMNNFRMAIVYTYSTCADNW
jgi:hypothetical protein